jgi:hypothetical protein
LWSLFRAASEWHFTGWWFVVELVLGVTLWCLALAVFPGPLVPFCLMEYGSWINMEHFITYNNKSIFMNNMCCSILSPHPENMFLRIR